jgi:hypothetical protein
VKTFFCAVAIVAVVAGVTASQAQMIDNFTANDLANYDQTVVLAQGTDTPTPDTVFSWDSVNDALQVSRTTGTTPEQNVFLRGDYSLSVGGTLTANVLFTGPSTTTNTDFGIIVAAMTNPTPAIYSGANVDVRSNYALMYMKPGSTQVGDIAFDGHNQISSNHSLPGGVTYSAVTGLWISEPSSNVFNMGFTTAGTNYTYASGVNFNSGAAGDNMMGDAVGFYADVRGPIASPVELTDLQIVPEPSTVALIGAGLGFGAMLLRRKRNRV